MQNTSSEINTDSNTNSEKLLQAVKDRDNEWVRELLSMPDIDVNKADNDGYTPLYNAALEGYVKMVKMLLKIPNIDVDKANNNGWTPLSCAASSGNVKIVKMLLEVPDIDVNKADNNSWTPLSRAALYGRFEVVKMLLAMPNIEVNKADNNSWTPLYWAAASGHFEIVKILLQMPDIDVNKACNYIYTPLSLAAYGRHTELVKILIEKNATRVNDKSKITNETILNALAAQEYIDDLLSNKLIEPIELTEELEQMVLTRVANRLESSFASKEVVSDIVRFEAILLNQKNAHPITCRILENMHDFKECSLSSDIESARSYYKLSSCASLDQLKYMWGVEGIAYQQLLYTHKNNKKDAEAMAKFESLKEGFTDYLAQKKNSAKNGFKVPEQYCGQVKNLFVQLIEIENIGGGMDIEALSSEEQEAILFYSLNPRYQSPGILTQEVASGDFGLDINIAMLEVEPNLAGQLSSN
jgi:ankyrin repeat protein